MAGKIKLVQGDTKPQIKCVITDENTGAVVNIAGATVLLKFRALGSSVTLFSLTGFLQAGLEDAAGNVTQASPGAAYEIAGSGGRVAFSFNAGNLDIPAGPYEGEIEITFPPPSSGVQTVYTPLKFQVREQF
jgi:hypothetical protein